ncbi:uncharacterized protein BDV17DRAFT_275503 [Aspergillus undulatus]|uniref:uncharacterized protein n=1 Tax=Aspergillus undulatus TaxID=1810928 RepID=UPI003CCE4EC7
MIFFLAQCSTCTFEVATSSHIPTQRSEESLAFPSLQWNGLPALHQHGHDIASSIAPEAADHGLSTAWLDMDASQNHRIDFSDPCSSDTPGFLDHSAFSTECCAIL